MAHSDGALASLPYMHKGATWAQARAERICADQLCYRAAVRLPVKMQDKYLGAVRLSLTNGFP